MARLQFGRRRNILTAVPKTHSGLSSFKINTKGKDKKAPAGNVIPLFKGKVCHIWRWLLVDNVTETQKSPH
jgi:hypothetical protein